jgi:Fe-S-cluster containining protein
MEPDFNHIFEKYEALVKEVDAAAKAIAERHPEEVKCVKHCSDCCHAVFDLSLIEAMYLNKKFNEAFAGKERSEILDRADESEREMYKAKRDANKAVQEGRDPAEVLEEIGKLRIRCPLLSEDDLCLLYDVRPVTCRLYGLPLNIGGKGRTCGLSGFKAGGKYPTVNVDRINERLAALAEEFVSGIKTRHTRMADILVPVGMALMNSYDEEYLGTKEEKPKSGQGPQGPYGRTIRGGGR